VVAVVTFGFYMSAQGHFALIAEREHEHHVIITFLALLSTEAIYLIGGVVGYKFLISMHAIEGRDWLDLAALFVAVHVTRALVLLACWPLLRRWGYGLSAKEATVCVLSGLRGAVSLALALLVQGDEKMGSVEGARIAFHTSGIVLGTLLINGTTITTVYQQLQIYSRKDARHHERLLGVGLRHMDEMMQRQVMQCKEHWFFHNCNMGIVAQLLPKLQDVAAHDERDFFGRRQFKYLTESHVEGVMTELAKSIGSDPAASGLGLEGRFAAKLRHAHVHGPGASPFLSRSVLLVEELEDRVSEELELAMALVAGSGAASSAAEGPGQAADVAAEVPANHNSLAASQRARARWMKARQLVRRVLGAMQEAQRRTGEMKEAMKLRLERQPSCFSKTRFAHYVPHAGDPADREMVREVLQMVSNAARSDYKAMFKAGTLSEASYRVLERGLEYQEEAIHGDLKPHRFLQAAGLAEALGGPGDVQMMSCFDVAWAYTSHWISRPVHYRVRALRQCMGRRAPALEWLLLRRDVELLLAFITTTEHILEEACILVGFEEVLIRPLTAVKEKARSDALYKRMQHDPATFVLLEHVLCARLLLRQQRQFLHQLAEEGCLTEADAHRVAKCALEPTEQALWNYSPTRKHLERAGSTQRQHYCPKFDHLVGVAHTAVGVH